MARNEPRPGHSVLGVGTFEALKSALNPRPSPSPNPKPSPGLSPSPSPCPQTLTRAFSLTRRPSPPSRRWRCGSPSCNLSSTPTPSAPPSAQLAPRSWACTGCTRRDPRICATARAALRPLSSRPCMTLELHCQVSCAVCVSHLCRESCVEPRPHVLVRARARSISVRVTRRATRDVARVGTSRIVPTSVPPPRSNVENHVENSERAPPAPPGAGAAWARATATRDACGLSRVGSCGAWRRKLARRAAWRVGRGAPCSAALVGALVVCDVWSPGHTQNTVIGPQKDKKHVRTLYCMYTTGLQQ